MPDSFYGGQPGSSFVIVKTFKTVDEMIKAFQLGPSYTAVHFNEHVLINTEKKLADGNGEVYRRGYDYTNTLGGAIYVGTIVGPTGPSPQVKLTTYDDVQSKIAKYENDSDFEIEYGSDVYTLQNGDLYNESIGYEYVIKIPWTSFQIPSGTVLDNLAIRLYSTKWNQIGDSLSIIGLGSYSSSSNTYSYTVRYSKLSEKELSSYAGSTNFTSSLTGKTLTFTISTATSTIYLYGGSLTTDTGTGLYIRLISPNSELMDSSFTVGFRLTSYDSSTITSSQLYSEASVVDTSIPTAARFSSSTLPGIYWDYISIRDALDKDTTVYMGFQVPYLVAEFEAEDQDPYEPAYTTREDDKTNPYYESWKIHVPTGKQGNTLTNLRIDEITSKYDQHLYYTEYDYTDSAEGTPEDHDIGPYRIIDNVTANSNGDLNITFTHPFESGTNAGKYVYTTNLNTIQGLHITSDYHLVIYFSNEDVMSAAVSSNALYTGPDTDYKEYIDLGSIKDDSGLLIGFNVTPEDIVNYNSIIDYLNTNYPSGLTTETVSTLLAGKIVSYGAEDGAKQFYAFDYSTGSNTTKGYKGWYYIGALDVTSFVIVGNSDTDTTNLTIGGLHLVVNEQDLA